VPELDRRELAAIFLAGRSGALLRVWVARSSRAAVRPVAVDDVCDQRQRGRSRSAYVATRLLERVAQSTYLRPLLGTGFGGAYTTFSTMQLEALRMVDQGRDALALAYALTSVLAGYTAILERDGG